jgi:hypothetical protein
MQVITGGSPGSAVWNKLWPNSAGRPIEGCGIKVFNTVEETARADEGIDHDPIRQSCGSAVTAAWGRFANHLLQMLSITGSVCPVPNRVKRSWDNSLALQKGAIGLSQEFQPNRYRPSE